MRGRVLDLGLAVIVLAFLAILGARVVDHGGSFFLQILAFAIANGGIYALVALGYTMVYGIVELINFAHGDVFAFGTFFSLSFLPILGLSEGQSFGVGTALALLLISVVTML